MNWKDCVALKERALDVGQRSSGENPRFQWPKEGVSGFNCESGVTISDIWGAISWIWTYPGDLFLSIEPVKKFFEIEGSVAIGAVGSTFLPWLILLGWSLNPATAARNIGGMLFVIFILWLI
jgi:hypothetical protein